MDAAIVVKNLSKKFGSQIILSNITHTFERNKIHGIVGNNGSGKSVFFKCICGFLIPENGEIMIDGKHIGRDVDFPEALSFIIETPGFLPGISGYKNLELLASLKKVIKKNQIKDAIKLVGLNPDDKKIVANYSLGMRQRLGIAQAIMENPQYLILDEPFNGLDKQGVRNMHALIKNLRTDGKTILLASHNTSDIADLCDTVCEMDAGIMTVIR